MGMDYNCRFFCCVFKKISKIDYWFVFALRESLDISPVLINCKSPKIPSWSHVASKIKWAKVHLLMKLLSYCKFVLIRSCGP